MHHEYLAYAPLPAPVCFSSQCHICLTTFVCTTNEAKLREHQENKHPKNEFSVCTGARLHAHLCTYVIHTRPLHLHPLSIPSPAPDWSAGMLPGP